MKMMIDALMTYVDYILARNCVSFLLYTYYTFLKPTKIGDR
jgi:hypothetical protein